ncbi:MAG: S-adenosylmethionine:tRNA ribosyltransferase-isomerase [Chloroflexi bacterium]|uniref:S-adenosylmethionine:tRNA ribosyltransferase-isomerase n=1 Tax=Candidatus Flexifilum breve TaxID=3140694 RepID=UPI003135A48B|nr:S-adenosylmethionine:tRNA ribosyltransferase-isomerase [Chloroflexota bacterium]
MKRSELVFERPLALQATQPAEVRGVPRDHARLMVSSERGHAHTRFTELAHYLRPGDLVVVNDSATLPASLPATSAELGTFVVSLATNFGNGTWLIEPRWSTSQPGPLPVTAGMQIEIGGLPARLIAPYPGLPRLWFAQVDGDVRAAMGRVGAPIRYGYINESYPLATYQTVFASVPGSAEMPSAAYPFTERVVNSLRENGVGIAAITLHTGVSSLEVETDVVEQHPMYPEPYHVSARTAKCVNTAKREGRRVIAVGTTVVRALETAFNGHEVEPSRGFTRLYIHPKRGVNVVDGLITGMHDPVTSHLAMLYTIAGQDTIRDAYHEAVRAGYLWHEFGDSHLILPSDRRALPEIRWIERTA